MAEYRPERVFVIFTIVCWLASGPKLPRWNRFHGYFALFVLVMIVSMLQSPFQAVSQLTTRDYVKLVTFYVLLVTSVRNKRDLHIILVGYVCVMALLMAHSLREFYCGRVIYLQGFFRLRSVNNTFGDQNYFSGLIVMSLPFAYILWREWSGRLKRAAVLGYVGLAVYCIILTGSRMGFCGLLASGCLLALLTVSSKRWRFLIVLSPVLLIAAWSKIPEANRDRYLSLIGAQSEDSKASKEEDYRSFGFKWGVELCAQRPLFGYGPGTTQLARGLPGQPHNTYGQVLGELGVAGTMAFGLVFLGVAQNFREARRIVRNSAVTDDLFAWRAVAVASAAFLLQAFLGWGLHFLYYYPWLWFGAFQVLALDRLKEQAESTSPAMACDLESVFYETEESSIRTLA